MVAKSYQNLEQVSDVYTINGRKYVKVRMASGATKQVRFYSDAEYARMYPSDHEDVLPVQGSRKKALGFENGYITLFKGDTYSNKEWFKTSVARYATIFGWYVASTDEVPAPLPAGIEPIRLDWEKIQSEGDNTIPDSQIKQIVEELIYDTSLSQWQGEIGQRIEFDATCVRAFQIETYYGMSIMHTFEDNKGNIYLWTTSSKHLSEGDVYHVRGTVKEHSVFRGAKQTVLSRCAIK